jgi:hypothetical protein
VKWTTEPNPRRILRVLNCVCRLGLLAVLTISHFDQTSARAQGTIVFPGVPTISLPPLIWLTNAPPHINDPIGNTNSGGTTNSSVVLQIRVWNGPTNVVTDWRSATAGQPITLIQVGPTAPITYFPPALDLSIINPTISAPANDRFATASEIPSDSRAARFAFNASGASIEQNEPAHPHGPPIATLWWKWTPAYSGSVRFKAVREETGLPLEVFTGNDLRALRLITDNRGRFSKYGIAAHIRLIVRAGQTYYLRTDVPPGDPTFVRSFYNLTDSRLEIQPANARFEGEVDFSLITVPIVRPNDRPILKAQARVFETDKQTPLSGLNYRAQLLAGSLPTALRPCGSSRQFFPAESSSSQLDLRGLFSPSPILVPGSTAGQWIFAQIVVWDASFGTEFETALVEGSAIGASRLVMLKTGSEQTGPAPLVGIRDFAMRIH